MFKPVHPDKNGCKGDRSLNLCQCVTCKLQEIIQMTRCVGSDYTSLQVPTGEIQGGLGLWGRELGENSTEAKTTP